MKTKKFLSMVLALAMIFSLCVSAFATTPTTTTTETTSDNEFTATATVNIPDIEVTVPEAMPLFINPLGFKIKIEDGDADDGSGTDGEDVSSAQIVSPIFGIENASPMRLNVYVLGTLTAGENNKVLSIASAPIAEGDTKNSVFIYAQFGEGEESSSHVGGYKFKGTVASKYAAPGANDTVFPQLALSNKPPKDASMVGVVEPAANNSSAFLAFKFGGECTSTPKVDWAPDETIEVKLAFTFKPSADQTVSGS